MLDDSEVLLKQGDVVVQRGTDHAWDNIARAGGRAWRSSISMRNSATSCSRSFPSRSH